MPKRFLTDEAKKSLVQAVKDVENCCSAEVVISVRARSGWYPHVELVAGIVAALLTTAFLLYSPYHFELIWFLIDPVVVGIVVGLAVTQIDPLHRLVTPRTWFEKRVRIAAESTFFRKGVRHTRAKTGILLYISLLERVCWVLPDTGVIDAVDEAEWKEARRRINRALATGKALAIAPVIAELGPLLEPVLERGDDDVNELPDEVDH